ncbi:hypothetical protein GCM10023347_20230 [Streptomyces chumphonensis]
MGAVRRASCALLLTGVALASASGCVTVPAEQRPEPAADRHGDVPESTPPGSAVPSPRETLTTPRPRPTAASAGITEGAPRDGRAGVRHRATAAPPAPAPPTGGRAPAGPPPTALPGPVASAARGTDVCRLGEVYGGWESGSRVGDHCRAAYGD